MNLNSEQVSLILDEIAADSSKKAKEAFVKEHLASDLFKAACQYAYNPFYIFGVLPTKADEAVEPGELYFDEADTMPFLDKLRTRELTGNAARDALVRQLGQLSKRSGDLLIRILRKDLRAGFGENTINKGIKDFIPVFPYQRCSLPKDTDLSKWPWASGVFSQEKADGMFANGTIPKGQTITFSSRQGTPFPMTAFNELVEEAKTYLRDDLQYHGELLVERNGQILPREIGNGILNSVVKGGSFDEGDRPVYAVWDFIPVSAVKAKGKFEAPYSSRVQLLGKMLKDTTMIRLIPTKVVRSLEQAYEHYSDLLKEGKEGTVIKHPLAHWKDGTSKDQIKLKLEADCELEVVQINPGKIGSKNEGRAGALHCTTSCGSLVVDVAVKNEKMRDEVDKAPDDWVGRIITVRSNQILKPSASNTHYSLFLPRMIEDCYRIDKTEADSLERIQEQFSNAINAV